MEFIKRTIILFFTLGYLLVSGGVLLVNTFCLCKNEVIASVYVVPEHCHHDDDHTHDDLSDSHSHEITYEHAGINELVCNHNHEHQSQGCEKSDYTYLKISNQYVVQEKLNLEPTTWVALLFETFQSAYLLQSEDVTAKVSTVFVHSPPPTRTVGKVFIIENQQLKIPFIA